MTDWKRNTTSWLSPIVQTHRALIWKNPEGRVSDFSPIHSTTLGACAVSPDPLNYFNGLLTVSHALAFFPDFMFHKQLDAPFKNTCQISVHYSPDLFPRVQEALCGLAAAQLPVLTTGRALLQLQHSRTGFWVFLECWAPSADSPCLGCSPPDPLHFCFFSIGQEHPSPHADTPTSRFYFNLFICLFSHLTNVPSTVCRTQWLARFSSLFKELTV